jgi:hypothetical protein
MVYRHISAGMKLRALQLLAEGWELGRIADFFANMIATSSPLRRKDGSANKPVPNATAD